MIDDKIDQILRKVVSEWDQWRQSPAGKPHPKHNAEWHAIRLLKFVDEWGTWSVLSSAQVRYLRNYVKLPSFPGDVSQTTTKKKYGPYERRVA